MPPITSDKDLPKLLDTPTKHVKWVKKLVLRHLRSAVKHIDRPPMQGMFSRTLLLTLGDGREVVQQFRTEPFDLDAFKIAKKALGPVMWVHGIAGKGAKGRIAINKSLGHVLSKGCLANSSDEAVNGRVRNHLEALLASPRRRYQSKLPLWVAHYDLNQVNVLIDEECNITGLIDWELSSPLPFGVGFGRIHTYAGEYTGGGFWVPDEFEDAERAFWNELFDGMPAETRDELRNQIDLVQDAVILGTLLDCLAFEQGKVVIGSVPKKALPKLLTYRIPFVRGNEPPYRD
ncbi:hypothetical protein N7519_003132 [Penicillium mononematosum]|uniref:uncharacterized protein n=1 Tax=Penicillium mononematosum TaxID=268346 RepID=UPI002547D72F|nr:uncharacterized protein N7519_003132 [Penicillium mononematosum]KAJ6188224.1 hypothetical protein N7519_003132 [Penicillium mononematosum]